MSFKLQLFLLTCVVIIGVANADIFGDLFKWDVLGALTGGEDEAEDEDLGKDVREEDSASQSNCECEGMRCSCCVDFNMSSIIDLGGPDCVKMRYISQTEGIALNVSFGESLLHSQTVTDTNKRGTCMELLSELAQICARFSGLKKTDDGLEGCLNFEPTVLGAVTSQYHVGCFKMGPGGMVADDLVNGTEAEAEKEEEVTEESPTEESEKPEEGTQSFIEAMNQSAEDGLSFISDLLGLRLGGKKKNTTTESPENTKPAEKKRKGKFGVLANVIGA